MKILEYLFVFKFSDHILQEAQVTDIHIERNHFRQHKIGFFSRVPFFCSHLGLWRDFEICFELNLSNSALNKSGEMYEKEEVFFVHES